MRKRMCNNQKLDLVNIKTYIKFCENLSICSQDIERKRNYDGLTDERTDGRTDRRNDRQPKSYVAPFFIASGTNVQKNDMLDLVNMNAYIKLNEHLKILS